MRGHGTGLSLDAGLAQTLSPQLGASDPTLQPRLCRILTGPPVLCPPGPRLQAGLGTPPQPFLLQVSAPAAGSRLGQPCRLLSEQEV